MGILTKIRQQPDNKKRIFSFTGAGILTVIIIVVWLSFSNSAVSNQADSSDKLSSVSPLQAIKDEFTNALSSYKQNILKVSTTTESSSSIPIEIVDTNSTTTTNSTSSEQATTTN